MNKINNFLQGVTVGALYQRGGPVNLRDQRVWLFQAPVELCLPGAPAAGARRIGIVHPQIGSTLGFLRRA